VPFVPSMVLTNGTGGDRLMSPMALYLSLKRQRKNVFNLDGPKKQDMENLITTESPSKELHYSSGFRSPESQTSKKDGCKDDLKFQTLSFFLDV
jgi:hypothetical protein